MTDTQQQRRKRRRSDDLKFIAALVGIAFVAFTGWQQLQSRNRLTTALKHDRQDQRELAVAADQAVVTARLGCRVTSAADAAQANVYWVDYITEQKLLQESLGGVADLRDVLSLRASTDRTAAFAVVKHVTLADIGMVFAPDLKQMVARDKYSCITAHPRTRTPT
jgi:hypothetical protein